MDTVLLKNDLVSEEKLFHHEEYLKIIVGSSLDGITVVDEQGKFEFANDSFFRIIEWPKEEIIGNNFLKIIPEEMNEFIFTQWNSVQEGIPDDFETKIITKSGEIKYVKVAHTLTKINGEKKVVSVVKDITENKKLELALKESEGKYRDLFENAQDAMYVVDTEGNFLKMNNIGLQALGYTREEFTGINISKLVTPESLAIVKERQEKRLREELVIQIDILEMISKNGEHRWVEVKTRDIKDGDKIIEIHGIARDITENIKLKKELKKSNNQRKLLCHLIEGSRGGMTRAKILKRLTEKSHNANQLAEALNMDYKTIRHHLNVLIKNEIITKNNDGYIDLYYISKNMESDLNDINQEIQHS